jgi:hypothetical protein
LGIDIALDKGDFDTIRGSQDTQISAQVGPYGGSVSIDSKSKEVNGIALTILGAGLGGNIAGTSVNTISVRQVYREIITPLYDAIYIPLKNWMYNFWK